MRGCITECDFEEAETCFPGIAAFYRAMPQKPPTFLELVWAFLDAEYRRKDSMKLAAAHGPRACLR